MPGRIEPVRSRIVPNASNSGSSDSITENTDSYSATSTTCPRPVLRRVSMREQRADDAVERGQRVADRDAGARRRPVRRAGDVAQPAHRLADHAEPRPLAVRPRLAVARDAHHDEPGIVGGERFVGEAPRLQRAGTEILDDDVGAASASWRAIAWPSGWRRSTATERLPRDCTCHQSDVPSRR